MSQAIIEKKRLQIASFCYADDMKNDKYKKARGGWSRILEVSCERCGEHICNYQKDGPGPLKRLYIDSMTDNRTEPQLSCGQCGQVLGTKIVYEKENRPAYRLFVGAVTKHIIKKTNK